MTKKGIKKIAEVFVNEYDLKPSFARFMAKIMAKHTDDIVEKLREGEDDDTDGTYSPPSGNVRNDN